MMTTEILQGREKRLYEVVGPLAMDRNVLRQNDRVAFKTSEEHVYFVALDGNENCIGFIPVERKGNRGEINNYYIRDRDAKVMTTLIQLAENHCKKGKFKSLSIIAQNKDYDLVTRLEFEIEKPFVKYTKFKKKL